MKFRKSVVITSITLAFILGSTFGAKAESFLEPISAFLDHSIKIKTYGENFSPKDSNGKILEPINYNGTTYLPLRAVAEATGMPVKWEEETRTASLGYETIQLNNFTKTSFVDIKVSGQWKPSIITNTRKTYSNSFMGVNFEINPLDGQDFKQKISASIDELKKYTTVLSTSDFEAAGLKGTLVEYESDAHSKTAFLKSPNSDEYYIVNVFVEKSRYEDNKEIFEQIISTLRKQK
ncbi:stalk domain-containing protein [Brevibacillus centrosporus]|uniref:stalk domain-containing protein n=1 Tax=Brevibacillus centrosporus TaxID=54910 RepID=UPI002E24988B|nr:stalk domain-containing protein [Brevibacillus centrosporus]